MAVEKIGTVGYLDDEVRAEAKRQGFDPDLAVAVHRSEYNPRQRVSTAGARGEMQLMPATARKHSVDIDDPLDNIRGGISELKQLYAKYNENVPLTLAAYNAGEGAVTRYRGIPPFKETTAYVKNTSDRYNKLKGQQGNQYTVERLDGASFTVEKLEPDVGYGAEAEGHVPKPEPPPPTLAEKAIDYGKQALDAVRPYAEGMAPMIPEAEFSQGQESAPEIQPQPQPAPNLLPSDALQQTPVPQLDRLGAPVTDDARAKLVEQFAATAASKEEAERWKAHGKSLQAQWQDIPDPFAATVALSQQHGTYFDIADKMLGGPVFRELMYGRPTEPTVTAETFPEAVPVSAPSTTTGEAAKQIATHGPPVELMVVPESFPEAIPVGLEPEVVGRLASIATDLAAYPFLARTIASVGVGAAKQIIYDLSQVWYRLSVPERALVAQDLATTIERMKAAGASEADIIRMAQRYQAGPGKSEQYQQALRARGGLPPEEAPPLPPEPPAGPPPIIPPAPRAITAPDVAPDWSLPDAKKYVDSVLSPLLKKHGYDTPEIFGSVATKGKSGKDLDVFIRPTDEAARTQQFDFEPIDAELGGDVESVTIGGKEYEIYRTADQHGRIVDLWFERPPVAPLGLPPATTEGVTVGKPYGETGVAPIAMEGEVTPKQLGAPDGVEKAKEPWEMTQDEFDKEVIYRGVTPETEGRRDSYWTDRLSRARMYSPYGKGKIRIGYKSDVHPDLLGGGDVASVIKENEELGLPGFHIERGYDIPIRAEVDDTEDVHRAIIEQALASGKLTPERAEELGHFKTYPDLVPKEAADDAYQQRTAALENLNSVRESRPASLRSVYGKNPPKEAIDEYHRVLSEWNKEYRKAQADFKKADKAWRELDERGTGKEDIQPLGKQESLAALEREIREAEALHREGGKIDLGAARKLKDHPTYAKLSDEDLISVIAKLEDEYKQEFEDFWQNEAKNLNRSEAGIPAIQYIQKRLDPQHITREYGPEVFRELRRSFGPALFRSKANGGQGLDQLANELGIEEVDLWEIIRREMTARMQAQHGRKRIGVKQPESRYGTGEPVAAGKPAPGDITTPEFREWSGGAPVIQDATKHEFKEGDEVIVKLYHGTKRPWEQADLSLTDFGLHLTPEPELASSFAGPGPTGQTGLNPSVFPVYVRMKNPVRLKDEGNFGAQNVLGQLGNKGVLTAEEIAKINKTTVEHPKWGKDIGLQDDIVRKAMKEKGIDSVIYLNRRETKSGKNTVNFVSDKMNWGRGEAWNWLKAAPDDEVKKMLGDEAMDSVIALDPTQIKSIWNRGTWSKTDPNILRQETPAYGSKAHQKQQKAKLNEARTQREADKQLDWREWRKVRTELRKDATNPSLGVSEAGNRGLARGNGAQVIAKAFRDDLIQKDRIDYRGKPVPDHLAVAHLAQTFRNPKWEVLHRIYAKDGKVVSVEGISQRLPDSSKAFLRSDDVGAEVGRIKAKIMRFGADAVWDVHNHPTGEVASSKSDRDLTDLISKKVPEFQGHVIIEGTKYGFMKRKMGINGKEYVSDTIHDLNLPGDWDDLLLSPEVNHPLVNANLDDVDDIAKIATALRDSVDAPVIVFRSSGYRGKVRGIATIPRGYLKNPEAASDYVRGRLREFGSAQAILYDPEPLSGTKPWHSGGIDDPRWPLYNEMYDAGTFMDIVDNGDSIFARRNYATGESTPPWFALREQGVWQGKQTADVRRVSVAQENAPYTKGNVPMEMPELVRLAHDLMGGKYPKIMKALRGRAGKLGVFRGEKGIDLLASQFTDEREAMKILAHEIGHLVDWLPEEMMTRGNILGRIAVLRGWLKTTIDEIPTDPSQYLTTKDRMKLRAQARRDVLAEGEFDLPEDKDAFNQAVRERYQTLLAEEIEERGLITRDEVIEELRDLSAKWRPFDREADENYTKYRDSSKELYADAVSVLLNNPALLRSDAPKFYESFFAYLERKPAVKELYERIQDEIYGGEAQAELVRRTRAGFRKGDAEYFKGLQKKTDFWNRLKAELIDVNHFILSGVKKVGEANVPPGENPRYKLEEMAYSGSEAEGYMGDVFHGVIKPLRTNNVDWDTFGEWMFHHRIIHERSELANPHGWTPKRSAQRIDEIETSLSTEQVDALKLAHKAFIDHRLKNVTEPVTKAGMFSDDMLALMHDNNAYATFDVVKYMDKRYGKGPGAKIYEQYGTFQEIASPATATMLKDLAIMRAVNRNKAAQTTVKFWQEHFPDEIAASEKRFNGKAKVPVETTDPEKGTIFFLEDGKLMGFDVPKGVATAFERNPEESLLIAQILGAMAKPFKMLFTELNYGFWLFNLHRDYFRAANNLPRAKVTNFVKDYAKGIAPAFRSTFGIPDDVVREMLRNKMLISIADRRGLLEDDEHIERMLKMYGMYPKEWENKILKPFGKMFNLFTNVGRAVERIPKIAAYKRLKERFPDMTTEEIGHIVRVMSGSPDFLRKSEAFPITNNFFLFSNAIKEGWRGDYEAMQKGPMEWWWKKVKYTFIPKMLMWAGSLGLLGYGTKKIMDRIGEFDKTNYITIPLGLTKDDKAVYWRVPQDETSRFLGGLLAKALMGHQAGWTADLLDYMAGQAPTLNPALTAIAATAMYAMGKNPYDYFRGHYVVPEMMFEAGGVRSHKHMAKWLANQLGVGIVYRFDSNSVDEVRGELEQKLRLPVINNSVGRFLKVSDRGLHEEIQAEKEKLKQKSAERSMDTKDAILQVVEGKKLDQKSLQAILEARMRDPDGLERNILAMLSRKYGNVWAQEFFMARTNEEKLAVIQNLMKHHPDAKKELTKDLSEAVK